MDPSAAARREAERWMGVAAKLLMARDLEGCKQFVAQALAADPRAPGADDLLAAADAFLAAQRRCLLSGQPDPYAVLGLDHALPSSRDPDVIHSHYRRLSLLLDGSHHDRRCSLAFADASRLVADAWAFLSDPVRKASLDSDLDATAAGLIITANESADKWDHIVGGPPASELSDDKLRQNFRLGDITWVKISDSSWWPALVIDEACVSGKPKRKVKDELLVRLYGTCEYLYVDPWKCNMEFEIMLKQENKSAKEAFQEALQQERFHAKSARNSDGEARESESIFQNQDSAKQSQETIEVNTTGTSSSKIRKRERLRQSNCTNAKESSTLKALEDETEKQDGTEQNQEFRKTATTGDAVLKGRNKKLRKSNPNRDKELALDKTSSDDFPEALKDERQKQDAILQNQVASNIATKGAVAMRSTKQVLRRSGCFNATEILNKADETTLPLGGTRAHGDATEVENRTSEERYQHKDDPVLSGSLAADAEIRAMVRDILFENIIPRQDAAELSYAVEVNDRVCNARTTKQGTLRKRKFDHTEDHLAKTDGAASATLRRRGINQSSTVEEVKQCNLTPRARKQKEDNTTPMKLRDIKEQEAEKSGDQDVNGFSNALDLGKDGREMENSSQANSQVIKKVYTRSPKEADEITRQVQHPGAAIHDATKNLTTKGSGSNPLNGTVDTTPSKVTAAEEQRQLSARQIRVMQSLALIAPSGSPFGGNRIVAAND